MKLEYLSRGAQTCAALFTLAALVSLPSNALAAGRGAKASAPVTYSGRALAFHVNGVREPVSGDIILGDTGDLPPTGGVLEQHAADVNLYGGALTVDQVDSSVVGEGSSTLSETRLSNYHVHFITSDHHDVFIDAPYIAASAEVAVNRGGRVTGGSHVTIQGLTVNGRAITITGAANQVVDLPEYEVKLIINEQVSSTEKGSGDFAVAAVHFYICECMEGHFGLVSAGISGQGSSDSDCGKVTGGGWISTPAGAKGTFGVSGGIRGDAFWGHLTYVDHGTGMKVQSTAVTGFQVDAANPHAYTITYDVTLDGTAGTATVYVVDNGEPGRNDVFKITLSTGYAAGGDLGGSHPGGGNIQAHKCPPGWD